jgi:tetratricopeptide (TPR) repeat protein
MSGPAITSLGESPLSLAESALVLVESDATAAAKLAEVALDLARSRGEAEAQVAALHALSYARHELGDPQAIRDIRAAIRIGMRHGLTRRTALARRRLAMDLADRGRIKAALRELDAARASLDPHERARSEVFRIGVLWYAGDSTQSLAGADQALRTLRRNRDTFWEAQLLRNRGGLLAERGNITVAEADLSRARDLFASIGATAATFVMESELARIALARGDLPGTLARLDAIDRSELSARTRAVHEILRARTLATAHLWSDALEALSHAEAIWRRSARDDHEGRLEVIRLTLLAGDPVRARALAVRAQRSFAAQGRQLHAARARGFALAAAVALGRVPESALGSGRRAAAILSGAGWRHEALRLRLTVARAAIVLGSIKLARRELAAATRLRRHAAVEDRVETWHVTALIRLREGDAAGAQQAARHGLRLLEDHRAALGASELRATASATGADLARLGLRIALSDGRPGGLFEWAEALRGNALRLTPVTPPKSPELRDAMTELRRVSAEISRSERGGRSTGTLVAQQARLETRVRAAFRHSPGGPRPSRARPARTEIAETLGDRALAEFVELEGELTAVTLHHRRLRRYELGPLAPVTEQLEWLRFALTRLANLPGRAPQRPSILDGALTSAQAIDEQLLRPLANDLGDRELVIVPTGALHDLPWSSLPSLHGRPVVVSPSAAAWWALQKPRRRRPKVVLVAGPRLRHATAEIGALGDLYPDPLTLTGRAASASGVLDALDGATVAHLACHGRFRSDSPLFSSLELADGPLSAYELQQLRRAPELIVLSACDLAVSDTHPGDELLGFAAALLDMGARTIIGSVMPVADSLTKRLMLDLHRRLIAGATPAPALAEAQAAVSARQPAPNGFVCLGGG